MDRKAFRDRLQRRAWQRYGVKVTDRMVKDWIDEQLLPNPIPRGRKREWSCIHYRRALQLCRLKAQGADRFTDMRIRLWFRGAAIAFSRPRRAKYKDVRESFLAEFSRRRKQLVQRMPVDAGPHLDGQAGIRRPKRRTIVRHMGNLSPEIVPPGFQYSETELFSFYEAVFFGVLTPDLVATVSAVFEKFGGAALAQWSARLGLPLPDIRPLADALLGLAGDPVLSVASTESVIESADEATYIRVRAVLDAGLPFLGSFGNILSTLSSEHQALGQMLQAPFARVAQAARQEANPWRLAIFIALLRFLHGMPDRGREISAFLQEAAPHIQRIVAHCTRNPAVSELLGDENPFAFLVLLTKRRSGLTPEMLRLRFRLSRRLWHHGLSDLRRAIRPPKVMQRSAQMGPRWQRQSNPQRSDPTPP